LATKDIAASDAGVVGLPAEAGACHSPEDRGTKSDVSPLEMDLSHLRIQTSNRPVLQSDANVLQMAENTAKLE
jgi:hypothetical protein